MILQEEMEGMEEVPRQHVLVVEDDVPIQHLIMRCLKPIEALTITVLDSGEAALEWMQHHCPDLLVLDIGLPSIDGYQVKEAMNQSSVLKEVPVIFLTAETAVEKLLKGFELGCSDYVHKPFESMVLRARVRTQLQVRDYQLQQKQRHQQALALEKQEKEAAYHNAVVEVASSTQHHLGNLITGLNHHLHGILQSTSVLDQFAPAFARIKRDMARQEGSTQTIEMVEKLEQVLLNDFKQMLVNDGNGMEATLRKMADRLRVRQVENAQEFISTHFSLQQLCGDVREEVEGMVDAQGVDLQISVDETLPNVFLPRMPLKQIMLLLVENSTHSIARAIENGQLAPFTGEIQCQLQGQGEIWRVSVSDNGECLNDEQIKERLSPEGRQSSFGAGMSMHDMANIVKYLNGRVEFDRGAQGRGGSFTISLPFGR